MINGAAAVNVYLKAQREIGRKWKITRSWNKKLRDLGIKILLDNWNLQVL